MATSKRPPPPPRTIARVRRLVPPPPRGEIPPPPPYREELPTLPSCDHCGGDAGSAERFKYESDPAMRAVRDDPIAGGRPGAYSNINEKGCRWCTKGVMTAPQRARYAAHKLARAERRKKR